MKNFIIFDILVDVMKKLERRVYVSDEIVNFSAHERLKLIRCWAEKLPRNTKLLDAGAGECQYRLLFNHCHYESQDFCEYTGSSKSISSEKWSYGKIDYVCDITAIPTEPENFDAIVCTEVLEHLPEPISALKEFGRILKPGGQLFLTAPLNSGLHQEPFHFYGGFTPHFYNKFLSEFGFSEIKITPIKGLFANVSQEIIRVVRYSNLNNNFLSLPIRLILAAWLPRLFFNLDKKYFVPEFTIGYVVEARKK